MLASIAAGLAGDIIVAKLRPSARKPNAFRLLGFVVPAAYFAAYFAFAVPMFGGTWWDASFVFGSIAEVGTRRALRQPALARGIANEHHDCMKLYPSAYVIALATAALHLAFCHRFGYYRDELYFIDCAKHLAWGYVDQPPLVTVRTRG